MTPHVKYPAWLAVAGARFTYPKSMMERRQLDACL